MFESFETITKDYVYVCFRNTQVQGYPSLIIFKDGKRVEEYSGSRDIDDLKDFVDRHAKDSSKDEL